MKFKLKDAVFVVGKLKLNMPKYKFKLDDIVNGMNHELEHGKIHKITNVTNDDVLMTGKIALAHLLEDPNYYKKLDILEKMMSKKLK